MKYSSVSSSSAYIAMIYWLYTSYLCIVAATPQQSQLTFDIYHIKTPQLIGIIAGCTVFTITISVVIYLLYASGTLQGCLNELREGSNNSANSNVERKLPIIDEQPLLYENLLNARKSLQSIPNIPSLNSQSIVVKPLDFDDIGIMSILLDACNGSPQYHESAYNPIQIWGWLDSLPDNIDNRFPWDSVDAIKSYLMNFHNNYLHLAIIDKEMKKPIGMISIFDNFTENLSCRIGNIWITPAYQGRKRSHEAMLLVLQWLFQSCYRRVTVELDARHVIGRKFIQRCGFLLETILRKHKIVADRNRDTALYVMLNHEWEEKEIKLKKYLGFETKIKGVKAFTIPDPAKEIPIQRRVDDQSEADTTDLKSDSKEHSE